MGWKYSLFHIFLFVGFFSLYRPCEAQVWSRLAVGGEEVRLYRDEFGVPHIEAPNGPALFEAFGYVVAQDRLVQLELSRREARGELAEIFGPERLPADIAARREFYTEEELIGQFRSLRGEIKELIEAYTRGINRWRGEAGREGLPTEFKEWGIEFEPWKITDCLAVMVAAGRRFGEFGGRELENLAELNRLGREEFEKRYPLNDPSSPTTVAFLPAGAGGMLGFIAHAGPDMPEAVRGGPSGEWVGIPKKLGSYAVVVAPIRSTSGRAILLGCPQMGLDGPQPGYEVDLHGGGFDVAGMTFPGVPIVLIGRNESIAWTVTSGLSDNMDVFVEELSPGDSTMYLFQGEWLRLETREEVFRIRGEKPYKKTFYRGTHGPIFLLGQGRAFSRKRTFWGEEVKALGAFLGINRARTLEDLAVAVGDITLSYNLFCATATGEIGYWHAGKYRILPPGADPRLPLSGNGLEEWRGFIPKDWLPHKVNPKEGILVNWNNKPSVDWPNGDNVPWVGGHRVQRIFSELGEKRLSLEDLKAVPQGINSHGTYQQVVELGGKAENILPPGEGGVSHGDDQKALFEAWGYKPFYFLLPKKN